MIQRGDSYEQRCWREALAELRAAEAEMAASMSDAAWHRWQAARATVAAIRGKVEDPITLPHVERQAERAGRRRRLIRVGRRADR